MVENEINFLLLCPLFDEEREKTLEKIYRNFPSTTSLNDQNMFIWLMSQEDYQINKLLGDFLKTSFDKRTKYLNNPVIPHNETL